MCSRPLPILGFLSAAFLTDGHHSFTRCQYASFYTGHLKYRDPVLRDINMSEKTHVKQMTESLGVLKTHT